MFECPGAGGHGLQLVAEALRDLRHADHPGHRQQTVQLAREPLLDVQHRQGPRSPH